MTTETTPRPGYQRAGRFFGAAVLVLCCWFAGVGLFTAVFEPELDVNMLGPAAALERALAASDVRLLAGGTGYLKVRGQSRGFVRQLYANGAWFVLPGAWVGCNGASAAGAGKR